MTATPWWEVLYDNLLADVLLERDGGAELDATLAFLRNELGLAPGVRVFDQCCGIGSLAIPLARGGACVIGVDQSSAYIERARRDAAAAGVAADFRVGDAFEFVAPVPCDAALNWWTSFGYTDDDKRNAEMLRRACESLAPGGRFVLDTMNVPGVLRAFQPTVVTRRATRRGEIALRRESQVLPAEGVMLKRWIYELSDGRCVERHSRVRLYLPHTLVAMLEACGFVDVRLYGDVSGRPLTLDSLRCICVARRPS
jgi:SAM-dependent methyltransferase